MPDGNGGSRNLLGALHRRLDEPGFKDWTYHGRVDSEDNGLVVVEYEDGGRQLLRDREARARGLFAWGYGGTGPHWLRP